MMKRILVLLIVFSFTVAGYTQDSGNEVNYFQKKHQIGLGAINLMGGGDDAVYYPYPYGYYPIDIWYYPYPYYQTAPGLTYKYHFRRFALRSSVHFIYSKDNTNQDTYENETSRMFLQAALGLEHKQLFERSYLYYGAEIYYKLNTYSYEYNETDGDYFNMNEREINTIGIAPLLGYNYFLTPRISLSVEAKFLAESYTENTVYKYNQDETNKNTNEGMNMKLAPLGQVSINIHL
jgi:hypothetical protein